MLTYLCITWALSEQNADT